MLKNRGALILPLLLAAALAAAAPARANTDPETAAANLDRAEGAMLTDPRTAQRSARRAQADIQQRGASQRDTLMARALWLEGEASARLADAQASAALFDRALQLIEKADPKSRLHARIIMSKAATNFDQGDVRTAFLGFQNAFAMFQSQGDTRGQAMALQSIGLIYADAGDHERVLRYYSQSAEIHPGDPSLTMSAYNNRALALKEMGKFEEAIADHRKAVAIAREIGSASNEALILANIASVELARGRLSAAEKIADTGLAVARRGASESVPLVLAVKAQLAFKRGKLVPGVALLPQIFGNTPLNRTSYQFRDLHAAASDAYIALGDPASALDHMRAVNRLDAEAREIRSSANAALMSARFDYASQEVRIARRDIALAKNRVRTQWIMLGASLLLLMASLVAFLWIRRSRNETRSANVQLARALAAKSEFLATTSHEIRTPLNGIMGMTQVLLHTPRIDSDVRENVRLIDSAGKAMKAIVDDLLDMAKIEAGEVVIERTMVSLPDLLSEIARFWASQAAAKGISIATDFADVPQHIIEDERKLRQIIFNLMSNAVKFTDSGVVTLGGAIEDGDMHLWVRDTGPGIDEGHLESIFEAFYQVDGATTRQHSGTGLGLAISRKLAVELGGTIRAESEVGAGSVFSLRLPVTLPDAACNTHRCGGPLIS